MKKPHDTSWGSVAEWYSEYLETTVDSYQRQVILPNILRVLDIHNGMRILDLACGQGFFSREFANMGATVVGADIAKDLIAEAKKLPGKIEYHVAPANKLKFAKDANFDAATIVLAIQNIEDMAGTFAEAARVLKPGGRLVLVMMHPAFRNPQKSSWGWDDETKVQYRRVDAYLSLARTTLLVHPGKKIAPLRPRTTALCKIFLKHYVRQVSLSPDSRSGYRTSKAAKDRGKRPRIPRAKRSRSF